MNLIVVDTPGIADLNSNKSKEFLDLTMSYIQQSKVDIILIAISHGRENDS